MLLSKQWNVKVNNFQNHYGIFTIFANFGEKKHNLQDLENLHRWW